MDMTLNPADESFAEKLRAQMPEGLLRPVEPRYLEEPRGRYAGQAGLLALPRDTEEVAALIRIAAVERVGVVPYGGGTGLVGGQVMPEGPAPLLISMERMAAIRGVYPQENVLVAEAGAILADVQAAAREAGRLFPLSLASEGTARIGGNLATNAGGVNVLRYGNARDLCLGLEAVLPNGQIWNGLTRLRKDNTGYDLRNLLIGAEGTLGIITAAALRLYPVPQDMGTAMLVVASPRAALEMLSRLRAQVGDGVSAFELIHGQGLAFLRDRLPGVRQPFAEAPEWSVLIELGLSGGMTAATELERFFESVAEEGLALDGVIARSEAQRGQLWSVREQIPEANRLVGSIASHDIALPLSIVPDFIERAGEAVQGLGDVRINCFGHLGDGNLHYNVFPAAGRTRSDYDAIRGGFSRVVHDLVHDMGGSISAEHGIGRLKTGELQRYGDPTRLDAMRAIKAALDPAGIMNPGAVLKAV